jgi:hypothetical protein
MVFEHCLIQDSMVFSTPPHNLGVDFSSILRDINYILVPSKLWLRDLDGISTIYSIPDLKNPRKDFGGI